MNFFGRILKRLFPGCFASGCGCFLVLAGAIFAMSYFANGDINLWKETDAKSKILLVDLSVPVADSPSQNEVFSFIMGEKNHTSICDFERKILQAKNDDTISAIAIIGGQGLASIAQASEMRDAILNFKECKKPVFAYLQNASLAEYFLASGADKIFINPSANLDFKGIFACSPFFGNALKKYGIQAQIIKAGKFKSFGEMFVSDKMSPENREVLSVIANGVWENILQKVSASRKISAQNLREISEQSPILSAQQALDAKMVDAVLYRDQFVKRMSQIAGENKKLSSFNQVAISAYALNENPFATQIAVVYLDGEIVDSDIPANGEISSAQYCQILKDLAEDDSIKGVVLRINSGGGSAYASEEIRRKVELLAAKKSVVASFGATAASGAYWIASACDKIVAQDLSITGSIGVFCAKFSGATLAQNFGVTFDGVKTAPMADIDSLTNALDDSEIAVVQKSVDDIYKKFIETVSRGRNISADDVLKVAEGKVFLAELAKDTKLFDKIGSLQDAIAICADLKSPQDTLKLEVLQYPAPSTFADILAGFSNINTPFTKFKDGVLGSDEYLKILARQNQIKAQMPLLLEFK